MQILVVPSTFIRDIAETETGFNFDQVFHIINIDDQIFFTYLMFYNFV